MRGRRDRGEQHEHTAAGTARARRRSKRICSLHARIGTISRDMSPRKPTRVARHSLRREIARELRRRARDLIESRDRCALGLTEPDLHALRLAARHLGAVLDVCDELAPDDPGLVQARAGLDELLELTGPVRDVQLRRLAIERAVEDAGLRTALLRTCAREQVGKQKSAALQLARLDLAFVQRLADMAWDDTAPHVARNALRRAMSARRRKLRKRIAAVSPDDADGVHKVRIALKRYGYLLRALRRSIDSCPLNTSQATAAPAREVARCARHG